MPPDPWDDDMLYDDRNDHLHEQPEDEDGAFGLDDGFYDPYETE